jgi:4-hydroxy-tetrahydrodipicolinate reductase
MRVALLGYGRMGRAVEAVALERGHDVVARMDLGDELRVDRSSADVVIEFTQPDAVVDNVARVAAAGLDLVVGTTGWHARLDEVTEAIERSGTGLVHAPNFSIGVHVLFRMAARLAGLVGRLEDYDVHLQEAHHRHKVDHPSGTARYLADLLVSSLPGKKRWAEGPPSGPADRETLWIATTRAGEIPGTHVIAAEGPDDRIELRHEARGRGGFARGAVAAAEWVQGRAGVFTVDDMLAGLFGETTPEPREDG